MSTYSLQLGILGMFLYNKDEISAEGKVLPKMSRLRVNWKDSSRFSIVVQDNASPPVEWRLAPNELCHHPSEPTLTSHTDVSDLLFFDTTFDEAFSSLSPPVLEEDIGSYCWPISRQQFMSTVFQQRAFVHLSTGERCLRMKQLLYGLDVAQLISTASSRVLWMKGKDGGMKHVPVAPAAAQAGYEAGHSINLNIAAEKQRPLIALMGQSLGCDFGMEKAGGLAGDVEMFLCRGKHVTPWHFDGQDNFTIQLQGTKKWTIKRGPFNPVGNANMVKRGEAGHDHYIHQKLIQEHTAANQVPPNTSEGCYSFVLRPGAVMYLPSGYWHHVESESNEGSVSMNFSLYPSSYLDVIEAALHHKLSAFRAWRQYVVVESAEQVRAQVDGLLEALGQHVKELTADKILPPGLFMGQRRQVIEVEALEEVEGEVFDRNELFSMVDVDDDEWVDQARALDARGDNEPAVKRRRVEMGKEVMVSFLYPEGQDRPRFAVRLKLGAEYAGLAEYVMAEGRAQPGRPSQVRKREFMAQFPGRERQVNGLIGALVTVGLLQRNKT